MTASKRPPARGGRRRHRLASAALVIVALAIVGTLYAVLAPKGNAATASADPTAAERGRTLFTENCASCHGFNAQGSDRGPKLVGVGAAAVDFQVGTGRMPLKQSGQALSKPPVFDPQQIHDLAEYVASLGGGPPIPDVTGWQRADAGYGGDLFRTNCAQCHNFAASGGELAYGTFAPSMSKATPRQIYEAMTTGPSQMPVFSEKQLTPVQKLSIIKYVRTLKTEPNPGGVGLGRVGPASESLVAWLGGMGALVLLTLWIGSKA